MSVTLRQIDPGDNREIAALIRAIFREFGVDMYEKAGFRYLSAPLGNSGHFACNLWMLKEF